MNNQFTIVDDVDGFLKTTKAREFYIVMEAPSGRKVYSTNGWAAAAASMKDWPHDTEVFNRGNLKERYYDIVADARLHATFADATEVSIREKPADSD